MLKIFVTDISVLVVAKINRLCKFTTPFLVVAKIDSKFILSNFTRQRLNSFKVLVLVSLFVKVFHAIAPLKRMEFLRKFVSGLGRMMFSFLLPPEFLCKNKSLNSVTELHIK